VAQEALSNVARHARATFVRVMLGNTGGALTLSVEDNGVGFDPTGSPRGQGLANMRSRAAECRGFLNVKRTEDGLTRVDLEVPSTAPEPGESRRYRNNALVWAALVIVQTYALVVASSARSRHLDLLFLQLPVLAAGLLLGGRDFLAYMRARRTREVRR
jgi:hypothetical protein